MWINTDMISPVEVSTALYDFAVSYLSPNVEGSANNKSGSPTADPIKLSMELSKDTFSGPDTITVSITVTNISEKDMPSPLKLYDPNGLLVTEFGAPVLAAGASKLWTGEWELTPGQLKEGKITFKISYAYYEDSAEGEPKLIRKAKKFSKKFSYTGP